MLHTKDKRGLSARITSKILFFNGERCEMIERILPTLIVAIVCSMLTSYMYYSTIQPQLDEIKKLLKKDEEKE